jgi:hypothetical protein
MQQRSMQQRCASAQHRACRTENRAQGGGVPRDAGVAALLLHPTPARAGTHRGSLAATGVASRRHDTTRRCMTCRNRNHMRSIASESGSLCGACWGAPVVLQELLAVCGGDLSRALVERPPFDDRLHDVVPANHWDSKVEPLHMIDAVSGCAALHDVPSPCLRSDEQAAEAGRSGRSHRS